MTTGTAALANAAADTDAALARATNIAGRPGDGDLHRAHRDGGWTGCPRWARAQPDARLYGSGGNQP